MLVCVWCWGLLQACSALLAQEKWSQDGVSAGSTCLAENISLKFLTCRVMDSQLCLAGSVSGRDFQPFFDFLLAISNAADYLKMPGSSYLSLIAFIKWVILNQLPELGCPHLNWHFIWTELSGVFSEPKVSVADDMKLMESHLPTYMEIDPLTLCTWLHRSDMRHKGSEMETHLLISSCLLQGKREDSNLSASQSVTTCHTENYLLKENRGKNESMNK